MKRSSMKMRSGHTWKITIWSALVNALQRTAAVVLQKSLREGFGLTVTEAMWKGAAVIGGNVGGIRHRIQNGWNGFLVSSVEETAKRIVQLIKDKKLRLRLGQKAKETVARRFLLTRYLEQYLDLFNSFEVVYRLKKNLNIGTPEKVRKTAEPDLSSGKW